MIASQRHFPDFYAKQGLKVWRSPLHALFHWNVKWKTWKKRKNTAVQRRLHPSTFVVPTDTILGDLFWWFFLPKITSTRSSLSSTWLFTCRSIFARQKVVSSLPRALLCMHIFWYANQTFSISHLAKTPPLPFVWNTDLKEFRKLRTQVHFMNNYLKNTLRYTWNFLTVPSLARGRRSGQSVTASYFGSNGPRFESVRGCCVESLDKALYSHCPKEKPSH